MTHGKTLLARKLLAEWEKKYPDSRIQVLDPKEMKGETRLPPFRNRRIHKYSWYQFQGGCDV